MGVPPIPGRPPPPSAQLYLYPVSLEVDQACSRHAEVFCERLQTCTPNQLRSEYGTPEFCRARRDEACRLDFLTPFQGEQPARRLACSQALADQSCREFFFGRQPAACEPPAGMLALDAPCFRSSQCGPGLLCRSTVSPCGLCRPAVAAGGDCGWWLAGCPVGTGCFDDRCLAPPGPGETCKTTPATCQPGTACTDRGCVEQTAERGASCAAEDLCDPTRGLHCDLVGGRCEPWAPAVALGDPCGTFTADGSVLTCDWDATCSGASSTARTCRARPAAGEPCDPSAGLACLAPAVCAQGVCVVPTIVVGGQPAPPTCR